MIPLVFFAFVALVVLIAILKTAIVVPQKILNQIPLVEVIVKDVSYLLSSKFIFGSGMRHSLDIVLSDNPNKVLISIGGGVIDWN